MARHTTKVAARLPDTVAEELDEICRREGLKNRSEALRNCIEHYIETRNKHYNSDAVVVNVPMALRGLIDSCIEQGLVSSAEELFKVAVHQWITRHLELYSGHTVETMEGRLAGLADKARKNRQARREGREAGR